MAATLNVTEVPSLTDCDRGWPAIDGAVLTGAGGGAGEGDLLPPQATKDATTVSEAKDANRW